MKKSLAALCVVVILFSAYVNGQSTDLSRFLQGGQRDDERRGAQMMERSGLIEILHKETILDGFIDPDEYVVGPMDLITVDVVSELPISGNVIVSPEGTVSIPMIGSVDVMGLTLTEAKDRIHQAVQQKYITAEISVSLLSPRSFMVHVSGFVKQPGNHPVSAVQRASNAVYLAGIYDGEEVSLRSGASAGSSRLYSSLRNIEIHRSDGKTIAVDLFRYMVTGDNSYNPRLRDGDVLVIPPEDIESNSISIYGGVRLPGRYEYREGDDLGLILKFAQGLTENAVRDSIQIARFTEDGSDIEYIAVHGETILTGENTFPLKRNDRIFVRKKQGVRREHTVHVHGEVTYTGSFSITRENTRLSEVVQWAGGFTDNAALSEAVVLRQNPRDGDRISELTDIDPNRLRRLSPMDAEEAALFNAEMQVLRNTVAVDFSRLFNSNDPSADVTLRDGDVILVPSKLNTVFVFGQVVNPGHVTYMDGMDLDYYIARSGGTSDVSRDRKIMVIKAGTKEWVEPGETTLEPGDAIFVPRRPDRGFTYYYNIVRDALQLSTAAATIYLLILQISRN